MSIYLEELIKKKLVEKNTYDEGLRIMLTDKGRDFLAKYSQMREFERTFGL